MKQLLKYFLRGLVLVAPIGITLYICYIVFVTIDPENDTRFRSYWELYHKLMGRDGFIHRQTMASAVRFSTVELGELALPAHREDGHLLAERGGRRRLAVRAQELDEHRHRQHESISSHCDLLEVGEMFYHDHARIMPTGVHRRRSRRNHQRRTVRED